MSSPNFMQMLTMTGVFGNAGLGLSQLLGGFGHHHKDGGMGQGGGQGQGQGGGLSGALQQIEGEIQQLEQEVQSLLSGGGAQGGQGGMQGGMGAPGGMQGGMGNPLGMPSFGSGGGWPQMGGEPGFGPGMGGCFGGMGGGQQQQPWTVTPTGSNAESIDLGNYTLTCNNGAQWSLTNKQTGAVTNVSGDPHVSENGNNWTFKNNTTFQLDDGTQITVKTLPAGNGQTVSSELDISKGGQGMKVTGVAGGQLQTATGLNGYALAASNYGDNTLYEMGTNWLLPNGQPVNQAAVNQYNL